MTETDKKSDEYVKEGLRSIFTEVKNQLEDLYVLKKNGITGVRSRIPKPNGYNGNGQVEYTDDFPSWYQVVGVGTLLKKKRVLIADEMGVGKTAQAVIGKLAIEDRYGKKTKALVIVPNTIKDQWKREIHKYCEKPQNVAVIDSYSDKELEKARDADFAILNYEVFGTNGNGRRLADKFVSMGFDYVILDEAHNVKNSNAYRSSHIKRLADNASHLCLLSGTPMPNNLGDTYMLISMLDPRSYPTPDDVRKRHRFQPELISALLRDQVLKRSIKDIVDLPPIELKSVPISLNSEQQRLYNAILEDDSLYGSIKLQELRKALLDPSLVNPNLLYDNGLRGNLKNIKSAKYEALDKIVKEKTRNGDKIVIFSSFYREGVTDKLEERYKAHGVVRIDGTVPQKDRDSILTAFQKDPEKRVFIGTTATVGEGVDGNLNAANYVVFLDEPYTSDERKQAFSRVYRPGQKKPVEVIGLGVPGTVDEGIVKLQSWKDEAERMIFNGVPFGPDQEKLLGRIRDYSVFTPIRELIYTPQQIVARLSTQMKDQGSDRIKRALDRNDGRMAKQYAENYVKNWDTSYSANTARLYTQVIKKLSTKEDLKRKVDIGSGPGILSHMLSEATTNIELNGDHFDRKFAHPDCKNIVSSFHDLERDLSDESFDLAVMSLSLDYTSNSSKKSERSEREKSVMEVNRILRKNGYLIVALPDSEVDSEASLRMQRGMTNLGFEMLPETSGLVRSSTEDVDFQVYLAVYRKTGGPLGGIVSDDLNLKKIERKNLSYSMRKKGIVEDFVLVQNSQKI